MRSLRAEQATFVGRRIGGLDGEYRPVLAYAGVLEEEERFIDVGGSDG
jgi:hypothetical protein